MSGRKIDYFGTFLESMQSGQGSTVRPTETTPPATTSGTTSTPGRPDPRNEVMKALRTGPCAAKDLIHITDNSVTSFLDIINDLQALGWVVRRDADVYELSDKGREIAGILA
jgi:hypothetical protein